MSALPTVFVSHGSPMHALQPGAVRGVWQGIAQRLPRPKAIVMSSAHWETDAPAVTGAARPETIHDFYNFPRPLYEIQYPAKGDPGLAERIVQLLNSNDLNSTKDADRGLDHGAWSPLLHMYPEADIPVIQVSVQTHLGPRHHVEVGRALAPLAHEGILLFGSGHMTHNLREMDRSGRGGILPYAKDFQSWTNERIQSGRLDELVEYRRLSKDGVRAHPTDEHFLPLFFALGAAPEKYRAEHLYDGIEMGALAMDAYLFH
jgi:4,5-DOPA dioxygenase extradiol